MKQVPGHSPSQWQHLWDFLDPSHTTWIMLSADRYQNMSKVVGRINQLPLAYANPFHSSSVKSPQNFELPKAAVSNAHSCCICRQSLIVRLNPGTCRLSRSRAPTRYRSTHWSEYRRCPLSSTSLQIFGQLFLGERVLFTPSASISTSWRYWCA